LVISVMTREEALTDLADATSSEILGVEMIIDGDPVQGIRKNLAPADLVPFAGGRFAEDGLSVEGLRLTIRRDVFGYEPRVGMEMVVDGTRYTVRAAAKTGLNRRLTLIRFIS